MRASPLLVIPPPAIAESPRIGTGIDLCLPSAVGDSADAVAAAFIGAMLFIDGLVEIPRRSWLSIGRALIDDGEAFSVRKAARMDVDGAIVDHDLALPAWYVRDALESVAWYAGQGLGGVSRAARYEFAASHGAAEAAALALLTRAHLPAGTLGALCAPFAGSIAIRL